jgi:membrane-associated phospholipid phosphatase
VDRPDLDDVELGRHVARELDLVGHRREVRIAGLRITGRRRRPTGESAPMPRRLYTSGRVFLISAIVTVIVWSVLFIVPTTTNFWERNDQRVLEAFVDLRTSSLTTIAEAGHFLGSELFVRVLRIGSLVALAFVRRWRHFFGFLLAVVLVEVPTTLLQQAIGRPRPFVDIIGSWSGPSHPSHPVAALGITLVAMAFTLVPPGRLRRWSFVAGGALMAILGLSRVYLGVDHPSDVMVSAAFAPAIGVVLFRWFAPEPEFPVSWRRGVKAHLDIGGARGDAIRVAVKEQLGLVVKDIQPFGQEGSGGSTPLRLVVEGDPDRYVFAKLYSHTHLRSDRWYKLGRTILYGSLEDEVRFTSVRRLVEYEDYVQRLMRDAGVPSSEPFGIVEVSPEREYLMVSEFLDGAEELTAAEIDDAIVDDALGVIRALWDAGLAHRDIKPANVMIRDGRVVLIDVAFGTVRPSPWRQAVDLANMMVILALRVGAQRVYDRALLQFAPEDIGEAFAATRSVTLPSQSRSSLALLKKERGVDLVEEFRRLAPRTEPISIQRWSPRRIGLTLVTLFVVLVLVSMVVSEFTGQGLL